MALTYEYEQVQSEDPLREGIEEAAFKKTLLDNPNPNKQISEELFLKMLKIPNIRSPNRAIFGGMIAGTLGI